MRYAEDGQSGVRLEARAGLGRGWRSSRGGELGGGARVDGAETGGGRPGGARRAGLGEEDVGGGRWPRWRWGEEARAQCGWVRGWCNTPKIHPKF